MDRRTLWLRASGRWLEYLPPKGTSFGAHRPGQADQSTLPDHAAELRRLVRQAEELFGDIRKVAAGMYADTLPDPGSKDTWSRARALFDGGPATALYFSAAERSLGQLMALLGKGDPDAAEALWQRTLQEAAWATWEALVETLGRSPAALRAEARAYPRFRARLAAFLPAADHSLSPAAKEA